MSQTINLGETEALNFNNNEVHILQLNGVTIWEAEIEVVPEYLQFTGVDSDGYLEGTVRYSGTPVAYALGKFSTYSGTMYKTVSPTPTTQEEYVGKYYYNVSITGSTMTKITETGIETLITDGKIVVGETLCYEITTNREECDEVVESYSYNVNNAFRQDYFTSGDLTSSSDTYIPQMVPAIEDTLVIPNKYNGKPVTRVLQKAIYGATEKNVSANAYVDYDYPTANIRHLIIGKNIKIFDEYAIMGLRRNYLGSSYPATKDSYFDNLQLPDGVEKIGTSCFDSCGRYYAEMQISSMQDMKYFDVTIPQSVTSIGDGVFELDIDEHYNVGNCYIATPVIKNLEYIAVSFRHIIFKDTVVSVSGEFKTSHSDTKVSFVFEHPANAQVTISATKPKSATSITIYTDNESVRNYDWSGKNYTVTFKSLSEFAG